MLQIDYITNSVFNSRTYILSRAGADAVWLVDCGDVEPLLPLVGGRKVAGVLLTHAHFDHIYGLNDLVEHFPDTFVVTNAEGAHGIVDPRLNMSRYHEKGDFVFSKPERVTLAGDGDAINLFDNVSAEVLEVPGHDPSCLAFQIGDALFTGDAWIPGLSVVTNFPRCDKQQAENSLSRLQSLAKEMTVYPGHQI